MVFVAIIFKLHQYFLTVIILFLIFNTSLKETMFSICSSLFMIPNSFSYHAFKWHTDWNLVLFFHLEKPGGFCSLWEELSLVVPHLEVWLQLDCWSMTQRKNQGDREGVAPHIQICEYPHLTHAPVRINLTPTHPKTKVFFL